jgi:hypothetical protein
VEKNFKLLSAIVCILISGLTANKTNAQIYQLAQTKLTIVGNAQVDYISDSSQSQFRNLAFKPIFLLSLSDRLFMESELEVATDGGDVELVLEYANMVYFVNRYLTLHAGRFLPKFGAYRGRFGEAYLQRFANSPVGFGDGGIGAMTETGVGLQGGAQVGLSKINYDFYFTNGPQLLTGTPDQAGQFEYEAYASNNKKKSIGGRFGFLPFSNSSLEVGYSIQYKGSTGDRSSVFEKTPFTAQAFDLNYFKTLENIKSQIRIIGEYKMLNVGQQSYDDGTGNIFTFNNKSSAYYIQGSIRPTMVTNGIIQNLELAVRYSEFNTPQGAQWFSDGKHVRSQAAIGINYWYRWNGVLKVSYQKQNGLDGFYAQLVYGF